MTQEIDCPHCNGQIRLKFKEEPKLLPRTKSKIKEIIEEEDENDEKLAPEIEIKKVPPRDEPYFHCATCKENEENENYTERPRKRCTNCDSLNGESRKGCKNCNNDEFEEVSEDDLEEMEIPVPKKKPHEINYVG